MKPKFTPKQVASFTLMIDNGILQYICDNSEESESILTTIGERFAEIDEGKFLREQITYNSVVECADERGEVGYLAIQALDRYCNSTVVGKQFENNVISALSKSTGKVYVCHDGMNVGKALRQLLRLRDWATKEDILKEIEELIK